MADSFADYLKTYDTSVAPLRASYQQQASQGPTGIFANVDPVMLGLAQGFLAPTRTGSFGESLGTALAGAQAPLEAMRQRQLSAQEKLANLDLARAKLAAEGPYLQARIAHLQRMGTGGGSSSSAAIHYRNIVEGLKADLLTETDPKILAAIKRQLDAANKMLNKALNVEEEDNIDVPTGDQTGDQTEAAPANKTTAMPPVTGSDVAETIASRSGVNVEGRKKWLEKQKQAIGQTKDQTTASDEEAQAPKTNYYTGDNPPKQYPTARKGVDGVWYVVKEGKPYPVLQ